MNPSVTICTPANGATVTSPVRIVAGTTSSRRVTVIQIYLDGVKKYEVNARSLDTRVPIAVGTRRVTVQARNSAAKWFKQTININVVSAQPSVAVSVSPPSASLQTGATQQFIASVSGTSNTAVTWSATGGTISAGGLYTAPSTAGTFAVRATSVADTSKSAVATVTVTAQPAVAVSISPTSATMQTSATRQFTATVTGTSNTAVTWSATGGAISPSGLYTAPTAAGNFSVRATSVADASKSASAMVTVNPAPAAITVSPTSLSLGSVLTGSTATRTVNVSNTGSSDATVFSASTTGAGFSVTTPAFPFTLAPGASRAVSIQFAPQSSGAVTGTASFVSNAPNSPTTITLSGTGTVPVAHSVDLSWAASTSVVSGYNVYRSSQTGGPYARLNGTLQAGTSFTDSNVQSGLTYFYVVRAVDSQGRESVNSNQVSATIPSP